jgi:thiol-disulfide isomerase/thioredoxin
VKARVPRWVVIGAAATLGMGLGAGCKESASTNAAEKTGHATQETMNYPIMIGNEDFAQKFGGLIGLPTSVLISRDGKMVKRYIGEVEKNELQSDIEKQLANAPANAGKPAEPDVTFPQLQGGNLPLTSLKGKVVLVNFWATWCEPCREEIPWLIEFQDEYASKGFTILGIAMDTEGRSVVEPFVRKTEFPVDGQP